jgi:hypothetical protein
MLTWHLDCNRNPVSFMEQLVGIIALKTVRVNKLPQHFGHWSVTATQSAHFPNIVKFPDISLTVHET